MEAKNGYLLLETTIALGVFMLVTAVSSFLLVFAANTNEKMVIDRTLFENTRIAMDVMTAHILKSDAITIIRKPGTDVLSILYLEASDGTDDPYRFEFKHDAMVDSKQYHRINFGGDGNELASYIADVQMKLEGDILSLSITSDDRLTPYATRSTKPVKLVAKLDVSYKTVKQQ